MTLSKTTFVSILMALSQMSGAADTSSFCHKWSSPYKFMEKLPAAINESSGIEVSKNFPKRIYHINDSGSAPEFIMTNISGKSLKRISLMGANAIDFEDLSVGPCHEGKSCLYIGDIGDNRRKRENIAIHRVVEQKSFPSSVKPDTLYLTHPDRSHNSEALAVHPTTGDLYILTKEDKRTRFFGISFYSVQKSSVFRVQKSLLDEYQKGDHPISLEYLGDLDIPEISQKRSFYGDDDKKWNKLSNNETARKMITSFDFSPDGKEVSILTYKNVLMFNSQDLLDPKRAQVINQVEITPLPLTEAIAFLPLSEGHSFIYSSETYRDKKNNYINPPIYRVDCLDSRPGINQRK